MCQGLPSLFSSKEQQMSQSSAAVVPVFGRRIVFFGAAEDVSEPTLLQLFSKYGDVTGLFLVRSALGLPSGCGYVTMGSAEQAAAAVSALQGSHECAEAGGKLGLLIVHLGNARRHSDCDQQEGSSMNHSSGKDNRTVFFTKVPPTVTAHQLIQLFTACGEVIHVELFTPWPGAKISKGCGLVEFTHADAATAAVNSLHQAFTWPHSHSPLVVEWLDSKRQAANRANKLNRQQQQQGSCDLSGHIHRSLTVPMDREAAAAAGVVNGLAAMYNPAGVAYASAPGQYVAASQQQHASRSCPLPRMQQSATAAGWMQGTPYIAPTYAYLNPAGLQQVQEQTAQACYYQQQGDALAGAGMAGGSQYWRPLNHASSNLSSVPSTYDTSSSVGVTLASTISNASTVMQLTPADMSNASLACGAISSAAGAFGSGDMQQYYQLDMTSYNSGQSSATAPDTSLAVAAAAALGTGRVNPAWQQLQQQNVMLLQPMSNPAEDNMSGGKRVLVPAATTAYAADRQPQALQLANAVSSGLYTTVAAGSAALTLPQQQVSYVQQGNCYSVFNRATQQQQQTQHWWLTQQQQDQSAAPKQDDAVMAVPLSAQQLQGMSAVLPDIPRLTGAKALLGAGSGGSGVQLILTGQPACVQAAHSVVAMLLSNMGIDEPLVPGALHQQC